VRSTITYINSEDTIIRTIPAGGFTQDQSLREQSQQYTLGQEHQHLSINREYPTSEIEIQPTEELLIGCMKRRWGVGLRNRRDGVVGRDGRGDWVGGRSHLGGGVTGFEWSKGG